MCRRFQLGYKAGILRWNFGYVGKLVSSLKLTILIIEKILEFKKFWWIKEFKEKLILHRKKQNEIFISEIDEDRCTIFLSFEGIASHFDNENRFARQIISIRIFSASRLSFWHKDFF